MKESRMDNPEKQATLRTQDRTKTNKTNNIAQKTIMMSITDTTKNLTIENISEHVLFLTVFLVKQKTHRMH
jgi:hypothetical protein